MKLVKRVMKWQVLKQSLEDVTVEFDDIQNNYESDINSNVFDESALFDDLDDSDE